MRSNLVSSSGFVMARSVTVEGEAISLAQVTPIDSTVTGLGATAATACGRWVYSYRFRTIAHGPEASGPTPPKPTSVS